MKGEFKKLLEQLEDSESKIAFHKNNKNSRLKKLAELVSKMSDSEKQDFVKNHPNYATAILLVKAREKGEYLLGEGQRELKEVKDLFGEKFEETIEDGRTFTADMVEKGKKKVLNLLGKLF